MKILHVVSGLAKTAGGTTEAVPKICLAQALEGIEVTLVAFDYGELPDMLKAAIAAGVRYVTMKRLLDSPVLPSFDMIRKLPRLIAESDVVHVHGQWHFPDWYAPFCARLMGKPYVMMPHGALEPERLKISSCKKKIVGGLLDKPALEKSDGIFVTASSEQQGIVSYGLTSRSFMIPLGINVDEFPRVPEADIQAMRRKLAIPEEKKVLLYFSRITQFKGVDLLAEAWREMRGFHKEWLLVLAGPDDHHGYLAEAKKLYASMMDEGCYQFIGPVFGKDRITLLQAADCFVLPTRNENFSFAVAEAMVSGVPVVTTKGAPWQILENVGAGRWVDVSVEAIRDGLMDVLSRSDDERADMGARGRKYVIDNLSWPSIAKRHIAAYRDIIEMKK